MKRQGFTLIELLIVVAIIGILAAIAIPNFLQAQIRAKVSRAQADIRTVGTALGMYQVDNNDFPPNTHFQLGDISNGLLRFNLTTPIDYLSRKDLKDPFVPKDQPISELYYTYQNVAWYRGLYPASSGYGYNGGSGLEWNTPDGSMTAEEFYGRYRMCSYGPDQQYFDASWGQLTYDPTNGTVSFGNINFSEKTGFVEYIPGE